MTRVLALMLAIVGLVAGQARAADQTEKPNSPKAEFKLTQDLIVGAVTLKPGNYKFQCKMVGDAEFLVVTGEDGKEVARVPCHPEELATKANFSDFRFTKRPDGVAALTGVRIRGEKLEHRVTTN